ncbi:MAG: AraC family transcriptional regulator [Oscillospiraceae bacterium]|nr:AraC family transcriptional regulator [Oscillospiraceae bacterium]MBR7190008.1 AraC family transcriptional regulator [Oscillospiraceae bacterium]
MEWLTCIRRSLEFMEEHLLDDISAQDVAAQVNMSPFFLQRGFSVITGYGISEYMRSRRLYLAALDLSRSDEKVIDIAFRYGYETPESFTKAFTRFHGATPSQVRNRQGAIRSFLPLSVNIIVHGGVQMEFRIVNLNHFKVIGFRKTFDMEDSYSRIPKYWDEIFTGYASGISSRKEPADECEKAMADFRIGEYGICIDDMDGKEFHYMIAGKYTGGEVPGEMYVYEFPDCEWAVFDCYGPNPATLQDLNTRIFTEWLPGNPEFELSGNATVEWYDCLGEMTDRDYHSAIWIPVKRK